MESFGIKVEQTHTLDFHKLKSYYTCWLLICLTIYADVYPEIRNWMSKNSCYKHVKWTKYRGIWGMTYYVTKISSRLTHTHTHTHTHIYTLKSGEGNYNPLLYSCLRNLMDRGAWQATVHGITKRWTWLRTYSYICITELLYSTPETKMTLQINYTQ